MCYISKKKKKRFANVEYSVFQFVGILVYCLSLCLFSAPSQQYDGHALLQKQILKMFREQNNNNLARTHGHTHRKLEFELTIKHTTKACDKSGYNKI